LAPLLASFIPARPATALTDEVEGGRQSVTGLL